MPEKETYSSWPSFTVLHHMIVQFCAASVGKKGLYFNYALLGDDIFIVDKEVADEYLTVMDALAVEISTTVVSQHGTLEFAERVRLTYIVLRNALKRRGSCCP